MRYIFVTGGVISSLGKGVAAASIGVILQARGFKVLLRKFEPYINIDPGTMSPFQHGEVFVTDDGVETDLDLGHYERFVGKKSTKHDVVTTGQVYSQVIKRERRGDYLGATIQVIPHITDYIQQAITCGVDDDIDFVICEVGGTVGDIECLPFLEALRQFSHNNYEQCLFVHLTLLPFIEAANELKTKPTQHSVSKLQSMGIWPKILLCRSQSEVSKSIKDKIAMFCSLKSENVIAAIDVDSIYKVPLYFKDKGLDKIICDHFNLNSIKTDPLSQQNMQPWRDFVHKFNTTSHQINIGIVGKYTSLNDAYKSINEALYHGGIHQGVKVKIHMINSELLDEIFNIRDDNEFIKEANSHFKDIDGIITPGGYGERGSFGKMAAARYCRLTSLPFLGICYGMQLAVVEFARNVTGITNAGTTEHDVTGIEPIVSLITQWQKDGQLEQRSNKDDLGGTMRLGAYDCMIDQDTLAYKIYNKDVVSERHRHRYEVNPAYADKLEAHGMIISGSSKNDYLPEIIEIKDHPWFLGVQFHPEFNSTPLIPSPLFLSFVKAVKDNL